MIWLILQIIDSFSDSVMSVCLTKTEIIGGSVDGTVRTFDIRIGRYVSCFMKSNLLFLYSLKNMCLIECSCFCNMAVIVENLWTGASSNRFCVFNYHVEKQLITQGSLSIVSPCQMMAIVYQLVAQILHCAFWTGEFFCFCKMFNMDQIVWVLDYLFIFLISYDRSAGELLQEYKGHTCKVSLLMLHLALISV